MNTKRFSIPRHVMMIIILDLNFQFGSHYLLIYLEDHSYPVYNMH